MIPQGRVWPWSKWVLYLYIEVRKRINIHKIIIDFIDCLKRKYFTLWRCPIPLWSWFLIRVMAIFSMLPHGLLFLITDRQLKAVSYIKVLTERFCRAILNISFIYLDVFTQCFETAQRESLWRRLIKTNGLWSLFLRMLNLFLVVYCLIKVTVLTFTWFVFVYKICTLYFRDNVILQ